MRWVTLLQIFLLQLSTAVTGANLHNDNGQRILPLFYPDYELDDLSQPILSDSSPVPGKKRRINQTGFPNDFRPFGLNYGGGGGFDMKYFEKNPFHSSFPPSHPAGPSRKRCYKKDDSNYETTTSSVSNSQSSASSCFHDNPFDSSVSSSLHNRSYQMTTAPPVPGNGPLWSCAGNLEEFSKYQNIPDTLYKDCLDSSESSMYNSSNLFAPVDHRQHRKEEIYLDRCYVSLNLDELLDSSKSNLSNDIENPDEEEQQPQQEQAPDPQGATDLVDGLNAVFLSERSSSYSNISRIDSTSPTIQYYFYDSRKTSSSPFYGKPLRRLMSQCISPINAVPYSDSLEEYSPWFTASRYEHMTSFGPEILYRRFNLEPMTNFEEIYEEAETEANRQYFPDCFEPFKHYGEISPEKDKTNYYLSVSKIHSQKITESIKKLRDEKLDAHYMEGMKSRHAKALEFARNITPGFIEGEWVHRILAGDTLEYFGIPFDFDDPHEPWTVSRGRQFINALIPSLAHSIHVEENLYDFINDFYLDKVVQKAKKWLDFESNSYPLSYELTKISRKMIKYLISTSIFERFIFFVYPILSVNDADSLYKTLVDTMKTFKLPEPLKTKIFLEPVCPRIDDSRYDIYSTEADKQNAFAVDFEKYKESYDNYAKMVGNAKAQERYRNELIRNKKNEKNRAYEYLKVLLIYLPEPIMTPNSRWINGEFLHLKRVIDYDDYEGEGEDEEELEDASKLKKNKSINEFLMGEDAHDNQDFFDALFFSRVFRSLLVEDGSINFIQDCLDPFFRDFRFLVVDSPIGLRYLKAVDKFIQVSRFNVVSNLHPSVIDYRRFLMAYLCRSGADLMGIEPIKVQARSIAMELFSLFESIYLYEIFGKISLEEKKKRLEVLLSTREVSFPIIIIFLTYNILDYVQIATIIETISRTENHMSSRKLSAYLEIFAMSMNVNLLPIYGRKILKYINNPKDPEDPIRKLENINENIYLRKKLAKNYEAVYEWSMSRRLKSIPSLENFLKYPYGTFAVRMLLARRFGISFDASKFNAQFSENFTWLECIGFANFTLEREAQFLINKAHSKTLDADLYQVYRVKDPQAWLHRARALPSDEPTHFINNLIMKGKDALPQDKLNDVNFMKKLFDKCTIGLESVSPVTLINISEEAAFKILTFFLDESNRPEDIPITEYILEK